MYTNLGDKKPVSKDWHRADIIATLHKAGTTVRELSKKHGYSQPNTLSQALNRRWPKGERLIAEAIGVHPAEIWPSRYPTLDSSRKSIPRKRVPGKGQGAGE